MSWFSDNPVYRLAQRQRQRQGIPLTVSATIFGALAISMPVCESLSGMEGSAWTPVGHQLQIQGWQDQEYPLETPAAFVGPAATTIRLRLRQTGGGPAVVIGSCALPVELCRQ